MADLPTIHQLPEVEMVVETSSATFHAISVLRGWHDSLLSLRRMELYYGTLFHHQYHNYRFGYNVPTTDGMRLFTVFYMVIGIYFVFSFISDFVNSNLNFAASLVKVKLKSQDLKADYQFNFRLMCLNMFAIVVTVMIGAVILCALEDWSFIAALYYAVETSTSVGYGDLEVQHELTHLFMCFYMLFSTLLFAFAFNNLQVLRAKRKQMHKMESMLMKRKELSFLLDLDKGPGVARDEFVLALLLHFGSIDYENDVLPWVEKFNELDKSGHGRIFREDLLYFSTEESANAAEEMRVFEGSNFLRFVEGLSSARPSERQSSLARASFADLRSTQVTNDSTTKSALHAIFEPHRQHSQSF
eukprot:gene8307-9158_t